MGSMSDLRDEMSELLGRPDLHTVVVLKRYDARDENDTDTYAVHLFGDSDENGYTAQYTVGLMSPSYLPIVEKEMEKAGLVRHAMDSETPADVRGWVTGNILPIEWHRRPEVVDARTVLYTKPGHDLAAPNEDAFLAKYGSEMAL